MKNYTTYLLVLIAGLFSLNLSATTYTYSAGGSWSPSTPPQYTTTTDDFVINGSANLHGLTFNSGSSVVVNSGGSLTLSNGTCTFNSGSSMTVNTGGSLLLQNGVVNNYSSSFDIYGYMSVTSLTLNNHASGTITLHSTGVWDMPNATFSNSGNLILNGTANWSQAGVSFNSPGIVVVNGSLNIDNMGLTNNSTLIGTGYVNLLNGTGSFSNGATGTVNGCTGSGCIATGSNDLGAASGLPGTNVSGTDYVYTSIGFYPSGGPTSCDDRVLFGSDYTINPSLTVGQLANLATITISSGNSLTVCDTIINAGSIIVESGASLVQNSTTDNNDNTGGTYTIKQANGQSSDMAYNIWSSPIADADLSTVFGNTNPCGMYVFNASTQEWKYDWNPSLTYLCSSNSSPVDFTGFTYTDGTADGVMDAGRGYFMPGDTTGTNAEKEFTGEVNNGTLSVTIYSTGVTTSPGAWAGNDWNLIGNPYPSSVDPAAFMTANGSNITDGLYFWDESISDYAVYASTGATTPSGFTIAVGQGFYVLADDAVITDGNSGTINFENSMRDISGGTFYKTTNTENHNVGYNISTPSGEINKIIVGYSKNSTDGVDKLMDAHKLSGNANIRFASLLNEEEFIIQGISAPKYGESKSIPLFVFTAETGDHTFAEYKRENIPAGMNVYLKDDDTGKMYDLSKGEYVVSLEGNHEYGDRFELVFENVAVKDATDETNRGGDNVATGVEDVNQSNWKLSSSDNSFILRNSNGFNGDIKVMSVTGSVVWSKNNVSANSVQIDLNGVSSGIYFIQVVTNNESVYSNKIVNP